MKVPSRGKLRGVEWNGVSDQDEIRLEGLRAEIDRVDNDLVGLLNARAKLAHEIGVIKRRKGQDLYVPARERSILERISRLGEGPLAAAQLEEVFRVIMSAALALERIHGVLVPAEVEVGVWLGDLLGPEVEVIAVAGGMEGLAEAWGRGACNHVALPLDWLEAGEFGG
ncbi:MAG TPA: chorismate mutase, partial [Kiritimatiellia bacterium]|nr:chorismate mutase [Kiritimatiellia bacterium]